MDISELEQAISEANFEKFCEIIRKAPLGEFPEIKIMPRLGRVSETDEDASIYLTLREMNYSPKTSLQACKQFKRVDLALDYLKNRQ